MSNITTVLFDTPKQVQKGLFSDEEKNELMNTGLYHYQAFSWWKRLYMLARYGYLMKELCKIARQVKPAVFLEIGCGTAGTSILIQKENLAEKSVGIDLNETRVDIANKRATWHNIKDYSFLKGDFLEFSSVNKAELIYSLAAFELIQPKQGALKKLLSLCNEKSVIVLDMANPYMKKYRGNYLRKADISELEKFFRVNGFRVDKEFYSFFSAFGITKFLKRNPSIHKTLRLIIYREPSSLS